MKNKKGSFSLMKRMNTALILGLIKDTNGVSRIDIAKTTGLTAATVTNLTSELIDAGIVSEVATGESTGGRKPVILKINTESFFAASAYISSNTVEVALADFNAEIKFYKKMTFDAESFSVDACVSFIHQSFEAFREKCRGKIIGLGLGLHGIVNPRDGVWLNAPNLNVKNSEIQRLIEDKCHIKVYAENNVRLMALAEMWFGTTKNIDDFVFLYVGKGVGGAIVTSRELMRGSSEAAGEIGHMTIDMSGPLCQCGKRGCLQAHTNESAMLCRLRENLDKSDTLTANSTCDEMIDAFINHEDKAAATVVEEEIRYLSTGISNIINIFNPKLIVLSSRIKNFDIAVLEKLSEIASGGGVAGDVSGCSVRYSTLGERAVLKGCVARVLSEVYDNPAIIKEV